MAALLVLAGCGGSSSSDPPQSLDQAQRQRLSSDRKDLLSDASLLQHELNLCITKKSGRNACVRSAAGRAAKSVNTTRRTLTELGTAVAGDCAAQLSEVSERVAEATSVLRAMAGAAQSADVAAANRFGAAVQTELRSFSAASRAAEQTCTRTP